MSNDYALFIIIVPNDFNLENSTEIVVRSTEQIKPKLSTVSALMLTASIPLPVQPILTPLTFNENSFASTEQLLPFVSICLLLKNYFDEKSNIEPIWIVDETKKTFQITFSVEFGLKSDRMLQDLTKLSQNSRSDMKVFVLPTTIFLHKQSNMIKNDENTVFHSISSANTMEEGNLSEENGQTFSNKIRKRINESDFKKSVRARLMVHQVVASIRASSSLSFDFVLLICLASMLAAFGLLENSSVVIVASMLVSPLMNPILGIVFGLSVRDRSLWRRGLRNEFIGLLICITCGFILGFMTVVFETKWGSSRSFPTAEMKTRGDVKRLWVGLFIALPSGAGVALSVLGGNTGSLVGVAISASLLPPAVNSGLLFAYAILGKVFPSIIGVVSPLLKEKTENNSSSSLNCRSFVDNNYFPLYNCNLANESAILACCSLLLTIVNIICIIIMALFILRIKEVVPLHHSNKNINEFFHHDVKVARDYNKTIQQGDFKTISSLSRHHLTQSIVNHWKTFKSTTNNNDNDVETNENQMNSIDMETRRKLFRLRTFAKEYDLDVFKKSDNELETCESEEKVRLLVNDLLDMCDETSNVVLFEFDHFQTMTRTTINAFYQEIIELLPAKWYQLFLIERQRRQTLPFAATRSYPLTTSLDNQPSEIPIEGTRFRLVKSNENLSNKI